MLAHLSIFHDLIVPSESPVKSRVLVALVARAPTDTALNSGNQRQK